MKPLAHRSGRVMVVQTVIPDYRTRFFEELSRRLETNLLLLSGEEDWQLDVRHTDDVPHVRVRNRYFVQRRLLWQSRVLRPALTADVVVLTLNPRIITSWIALLLRRLLRRRTVLWGHAWPRKGPRSATDRVRWIMRRLASTVIVYTETEATQLRRVFSEANIVAAPNALYRRSELVPGPATGPVTDLVCVGRLTPSKKPQILLEAFIEARRQLPQDVRLVFVGDGPLRGFIEARVRSLGLEEHVVLTGHVSSVEHLRDTYAHAIASVSAGDVGLSLIQSLGFGVPMILAEDSDHGPELEAAIAGMNVIFFHRDPESALVEAILEVVRQREEWLSRRSQIARPIRERYSIETMVTSFLDGLRIDGKIRRDDDGAPPIATQAAK